MGIESCPECGAYLSPRSTDQNALLHALLTRVAQQRQWAGQWLSVEDWKRLVTAAFVRAQGRTPRILPALDGAGVDVLYRRTSRMSKKEMTDLIDWLHWWCAENGVLCD